MTKPRKNTAGRSLAKFSFFALVALVLFAYRLTLPASSQSAPQDFVVEMGSSVVKIASDLDEAGLIRSPLYFRALVRLHNLTLQAGYYNLSPDSSPLTIARSMTRGLALDQILTIPEGYRTEQIAEAAGLSIPEFLTAAKGLEGQLFPDTYFVKNGITSAELVKLMHDNFVTKVGEIDRDTLIMASLVERETRGNEEKPIVAGILQKRLDAGWPLELDATVQYFLGKKGAWWPNTTLLDRKLSSPYNTYQNRGLPPGPICNPGLSSIQAVKNAASSPYWFYLHDRTGQIHYGATLEEHNQNIAKYIK